MPLLIFTTAWLGCLPLILFNLGSIAFVPLAQAVFHAGIWQGPLDLPASAKLKSYLRTHFTRQHYQVPSLNPLHCLYTGNLLFNAYPLSDWRTVGHKPQVRLWSRLQSVVLVYCVHSLLPVLHAYSFCLAKLMGCFSATFEDLTSAHLTCVICNASLILRQQDNPDTQCTR